jgi:hypothetical protein
MGLESSPHWKAWFELGTLRVTGSATRYPNDFSTASLAREPDDPTVPDLLIYRVVFHRDKEPFCGPDLMGPVSYYEQRAPVNKRRIRIIAAEGTFEIALAGHGA